jgi:hypothetical protein
MARSFCSSEGAEIRSDPPRIGLDTGSVAAAGVEHDATAVRCFRGAPDLGAARGEAETDDRLIPYVENDGFASAILLPTVDSCTWSPARPVEHRAGRNADLHRVAWAIETRPRRN